MWIFWAGRGWCAPCLLALGMFLPMIVLRQIDGPEVDRGVGLAVGLAALVIAWLGLRWNRGGKPSEPARHSFWGLPLQFWAIPMLVFAILLGTHVITTAEEPRGPRSAIPTGALK
ncbi:hypothetical protein GXW71_11410 [Roseomonas hellenica]|uniref:Uncharacterized protein n=1 Tax=Plastoroseomonas hellenica TaxID=2687306 RepID=A0ABS5EXE4_9PROT|nr:hypothetical protein [Plastoroseomonas hellenica]